MFSNKNIVKYCAKYFVVMTVMAYIFNLSASLVNQKSDVAEFTKIRLERKIKSLEYKISALTIELNDVKSQLSGVN